MLLYSGILKAEKIYASCNFSRWPWNKAIRRNLLKAKTYVRDRGISNNLAYNENL